MLTFENKEQRTFYFIALYLKKSVVFLKLTIFYSTCFSFTNSLDGLRSKIYSALCTNLSIPEEPSVSLYRLQKNFRFLEFNSLSVCPTRYFTNFYSTTGRFRSRTKLSLFAEKRIEICDRVSQSDQTGQPMLSRFGTTGSFRENSSQRF